MNMKCRLGLHHYHKTGNRRKRIIRRHGKFGNEVHIMLEEECCRCDNMRWVAQWIDSHSGTGVYNDDSVPDLKYV